MSTSADRKKIYLSVSYSDKDIAKNLGAKWDADNRLWYIPTLLDDEKCKILLERFPKAGPYRI